MLYDSAFQKWHSKREQRDIVSHKIHRYVEIYSILGILEHILRILTQFHFRDNSLFFILFFFILIKRAMKQSMS